MATRKIAGGAYKMGEEAGITGASPELIDGYVDKLQNNIKRAGALIWSDLNVPARYIRGLFTNYVDKSILVSLSDGSLYRTSFLRHTDMVSAAGSLSTTYPPIFANDDKYTWIASGDGRLRIYPHGGVSLSTADINSPANPTHVAILRGYLVANDRDTNLFYFAGPLSTERMTWDALNFASPESNPDSIKALGTLSSDIVMLGERSCELWGVDEVTPFYPVVTMDVGISAPYSFFVYGDAAFWLDSARHIVALTARQIKPLSMKINKVFDEMAHVEDCRGFPLLMGGTIFIVFTFPTEKQTWAMSLDTGEWSRFGYWNEATQEYSHFLGLCGTVLNADIAITDKSIMGYGQSIIGSRLSSKLYKMDTKAYTDDGNPIRFLRRTGVTTYNTFRQKRANSLEIRAITPYNAPYDAPSRDPWSAQSLSWNNETRVWTDFTDAVISMEGDNRFYIRWRDNGMSWSSWHTVYCDSRDGCEATSTLRRLGIFKTRQYEIMQDATTGFTLVEAEENAEII